MLIASEVTEPAKAAPLLTEAQMLAAPADDYMSVDQLAFFKDRLCTERDALLRAAGDTAHHLQEFEATPDPSDRASLEEDHSLELRVRDRERQQLHRIDQALMRIRDGSYGWCSDTGEPIGMARLLARPTATLSLEAQERYEVRRKMKR
jgi:DnaK suppressor protein